MCVCVCVHMCWLPLAGWDDLRSDVYLLYTAMSLTFPCALLQVYQDVEDEDTLKVAVCSVTTGCVKHHSNSCSPVAVNGTAYGTCIWWRSLSFLGLMLVLV